MYKRQEWRGLELEVLALGGPRMEAAGAVLIADTAPMGAIGLWEAFPLILPTLRLQARVDALLEEQPLDGVVLIDYVGANVRLGTRLRSQQPELPITYYIAPQEWAWRFGDGSSTRLIEFTDKVLAVFPAEAEFYSARGADGAGWAIRCWTTSRTCPIAPAPAAKWVWILKRRCCCCCRPRAPRSCAI